MSVHANRSSSKQIPVALVLSQAPRFASHVHAVRPPFPRCNGEKTDFLGGGALSVVFLSFPFPRPISRFPCPTKLGFLSRGIIPVSPIPGKFVIPVRNFVPVSFVCPVNMCPPTERWHFKSGDGVIEWMVRRPNSTQRVSCLIAPREATRSEG
jgi:hypothetical protein